MQQMEEEHLLRELILLPRQGHLSHPPDHLSYKGSIITHFTEEHIKAQGQKGIKHPRPNLNSALSESISPSHPHLPYKYVSLKLILFLSPYLASGNLTCSYGFETSLNIYIFNKQFNKQVI